MAVLIDSQTTGGTQGYVLASDSNTAVGQSIDRGGFPPTFGTVYVLDSVVFKLYREGSPTGNIVARVYLATGVHGDNSVPTGGALAISDVIDVSTIPTSYTDITFTFSNVAKIVMDDDFYLVITCEYAGGDISNHIGISNDVGSLHSGNLSYIVSNWTAVPDDDLYFKLYGNLLGPTVGEKYPLPAFKNG